MTDPFAIEELAEVAAVLRDGGDPWAEWPELAQHLLACDRCRDVLADLVSVPATADGPLEAVDVDRLFDAALVAALDRPDARMRERAAQRLGAAPHRSDAALAALRRVAAADPDDGARAAARQALDREAPEPA